MRRAVLDSACLGVGSPRDWKQFPGCPPLKHAYMIEDAPQAPLVIITSVDGRIASSEYFLIIKVDARSVAGLSVSAAWDE